jgi:CheY-like chemotaxis protein
VILVVDDHVDTRAALVRLLVLDGYKPVGVGSGRDALRFLETNRPRLVVLDYSMPDIDGITVFRTMKADARLRDVPVVMFSAFDGPTRDEALREGMAAYVVKGTLDWAVLRKEIARLAGDAAPRPAPATPPHPNARERKSAE